LKRLWKPSPGLTSIGNIVIKAKPFENLAEAHAMQFIARHTSVPVPKVYCAFVLKGKTYIVMSRLRGHMAAYGWKNRPQESKARILDQLRRMVAEIRSVHPPRQDIGVSNVNGGPFFDCRLPSKHFWGPFATTREFHEALIGDFDPDVEYESAPDGLPELLRFYQQANHGLVFTHGDLSSFNIMVEGDEVVGILDWETAGWFPSYWEYACARNVNPHNLFWEDKVDRFLIPMPEELQMDEVRRRYFGDF
ncbi:kinase-like domain-containing protein, partial [Stachybotrys elegans]